MAALHLNDAGTWRRIQSVYVNDAGTWRTIQKIYLNDAGTWRQVYTRRPPESGTVNVQSSGTEIGASRANFGNGTFGTITGFTLTDGSFVQAVTEDVTSNVTRLRLRTPTGTGTFAQDYFNSITVNGNNLTSASAALFSSGSGLAVWEWSGKQWGLVAALGTTVGFTINF